MAYLTMLQSGDEGSGGQMELASAMEKTFGRGRAGREREILIYFMQIYFWASRPDSKGREAVDISGGVSNPPPVFFMSRHGGAWRRRQQRRQQRREQRAHTTSVSIAAN